MEAGRKIIDMISDERICGASGGATIHPLGAISNGSGEVYFADVCYSDGAAANSAGDAANMAGHTDVVNGASACSSEDDGGVLRGIVTELMETSSDSSESDDDEIYQIVMDNSDSDDEDLLEELLRDRERKKRNSIKNYLEEVVPTYTEAEFKMHFRISKELFLNLSAKFEESDIYKRLRVDKRLPGKTNMAVFLWFAGHEACSFRDLSDRFNISLSTVSRMVNRTTMFISSLSPEVIRWPTEEKKRDSALFFTRKCGFAKAIGCIDGTHIVIDPPAERKDDYIDRKGNITLTMQAICDENKKFINIFVGFPGSSHDSWVFQNSPIYQKLSSYCGDYYLLGDSAYPCTQYVITPYKDNGHLTAAQKNFNVKLSSGRVAIEHTFGILKQRFRQLYYCKLRGSRKLCHFIRACCVLHNIANESDLEFSPEVLIEERAENECGETARGNSVRDAICMDLPPRQQSRSIP
ncbi:PREDICTED: uncharacterized protein LOC108361483 [Rhagoletis zephyria]|uniref:uncharacterized protein LOC108361483 n=1 Tax=Rhagoletis zephyria TaxID=28612 RepID=UPI000811372F|nr:PREDICTED: uncharacterized protein LOC108361483 [Rhagoletis zephyria]